MYKFHHAATKSVCINQVIVYQQLESVHISLHNWQM